MIFVVDIELFNNLQINHTKGTMRN